MSIRPPLSDTWVGRLAAMLALTVVIALCLAFTVWASGQMF